MFFPPRSGFVQQPHQLGLAIPLRSIASRLCGTLAAQLIITQSERGYI
jgi:hypothetical protein